MDVESKKTDAIDLPKAYDPKAVEDGIYSAWEKSGFFNPDNLPGKRKKSFTVMMPPPNATGTLHIGHAMFMTLEDIMVRFARMRGLAALWMPGTDHAAIATNTKVEKILATQGKTKYDLGREKFIEKVEEFITGSQGTIRKQIRKMGSSCDWSREAYTMDEPRSAAVREMFARMYKDGLIYRGYRIVNWCPRCESTLADDEVEYKEEKSTFYYFKYGPIVIGTARPETKFLDKTIVVHPDDPRYQHLIGKTFDVEWIDGKVKANVITDPLMDREFGTGAMTITPAHDFHDFELAQKHNLPVVKIIDEKGNFTAAAGAFAGKNARASRAEIVEILRRKGLVERVDENYVHNVSICYRCSTAIEPLTSRQWFVDVNHPVPGRGKSLKQMAIEAVRKKNIEIVPDRFEKVYFHWMENLRDWCISRQVWFGHRVPVWYCESCYVDEDPAPRAGSGERESRKHVGMIVSVEPPTVCPTCERPADLTKLSQDPDSLDTWFSSGTWTFSTLGWPEKSKDLKKFHPTQVLETGYDILFFWVARMIMMTLYAVDEVPFERVYLHGLVRDEQGRKMSKSLENIIDPLDVSDKFGTDAVRLSLVIGNSAGNDLKLSEEKIAYFRNFTNKLWNIGRFAAMQIGTAPLKRTRPKPKTLADRWILARLDETVGSMTKDLEDLEFSRPGEALRDFTWGDMADWYLEIAKIEKGKEAMLAYMLETVLTLWHPFMPFVTEELYRTIFARNDKDFLMVASWPKAPTKKDKKSSNEFALVRDIVVAIRNLRSTYHVEPSKTIDATIVAGKNAKFLAAQTAIIAGLARVGSLQVVAKAQQPPQSASAVVGGMNIFVPMGSLVDTKVEKERITKELAEAERYLVSLDGKLANKDFIARAPAAVVDSEKKKRADAAEKIAKLNEQLAALA